MGKEDRQRVREERLFGGENHKWWVLATVGVGVLMATLDASIVNIALPTILEDLNTNLLFVQWVLEAYLLAITVLLLPFGRLSDIVGRKRVYSAGFLIFVLGSGLSGFSRTAEELIAFRVLQAVGAAMILANGFAIVTAVFPPWQRGTALGSLGTVVAAGFALGPTVGGLLIDSLGWPWIFYVNVPIGIIGTTAAWVILNERVLSGGRRQSPQRFDFAGAVLSVLALLALLMALTLGPEVGWISPLVLLLGAAFVLLTAAFFVVEARLEQPLVDLSLFRRRTFTAGNVAGIMAFLAISANAFLMPFYLQLVQGYSPLQAGLLLTPTALVLAVVAPISGWLSDRIGARILSSVGLAINGVALLLLGSLSVDASYTQVLYWLLLLGFGQGMFQAPNNSSVMGDVPRDRLGIGSGILSMVRNLGQVVGLAVSASFAR
ncbi:MAG: MFS transporter [Bacteroidetes bacterium]|nr:MFS transporter [Bacteroidota bacterium]